jgi:Mce-associated membrane protein
MVRRSRVFRVVLPALVLALLGTATAGCSEGEHDLAPGMLVAAKLEAKYFFSLDYRHADEDVDRVLALATGSFKKDYAARRKEVVDGVVKKKLVVSATVPQDGAGLEYLQGNRGQVLVAVDVTTTTSSGASTVNRYRTRVFLTRVKDRWLVSDLNQVG